MAMSDDLTVENWRNLSISLDALGEAQHRLSASKGFWTKADGEAVTEDDVAEVASKIALVSGEAHELLEAWRMPDPWEHCGKEGCELDRMAEELADIQLRLVDLATFFCVDLGLAVKKKLEYNRGRVAMHGKRF